MKLFIASFKKIIEIPWEITEIFIFWETADGV